MKFLEYIELKENTLYSSQAEKDAITRNIISSSQVDYIAGIPTVEFKTKQPSATYHGTYAYQMTSEEKKKLYDLFKTSK